MSMFDPCQETYHCDKCGYEWNPRVMFPRNCPNCGWDFRV